MFRTSYPVRVLRILTPYRRASWRYFLCTDLRPASFIAVIFAIPGVRTGSGRAGVPRFHRFTADDDSLPRTGSDVIGLALVGKARSTCL